MFSANGHPPSAGDPGLEVRGMNTCFASIFATASPDKPLDSADLHLSLGGRFSELLCLYSVELIIFRTVRSTDNVLLSRAG